MTITISKNELAALQDLIYEAAQTLRVLPDKERMFLRAGERCCWPQTLLTYWEAYGIHGARLRLPAPTVGKITRMEETLSWIAWLGQIDHELMKVVWLCCGEDRSPQGAGAMLGLHRDTVRLKRDKGLRMIAEKFAVKIAA